MIRTITMASALLLTASTLVQAEDSESTLLNIGFNHQHLRSIDMNISTQEYEQLYNRNRRFVRRTLGAYSKDTLEQIGIPERVINVMGAAVGMVMNGSRLNLNKSKTLALEFRDVGTSEPSLYFGISLDW